MRSAVGLLAHDERHLGVGLVAQHAVGDVRAGAFERLRPFDVAGLVEARLELDQDRDLLAALGGLDERLHHRRVARGAVERLLDRQHRRVLGRDPQEALDRAREGVVGMVHEQVAAADHPEEVDLARVARGLEARVGLRPPLRLLQRRQIQRGELKEVARRERRPHLVDVGRPDHELVGEQQAHPLGHLRHDLEPHHRGEAPGPQLLLHRLEQILGLLLVLLDVGRPRHPERIRLEELHPRKEALEELGDHHFERDEAQRVRKLDPARQAGRHLEARKADLGARRRAQGDRQRKREVGDERKRVRSVEPERSEDREDEAGEELLEMAALRRREVAEGDQLDAVPGDLRQHLLEQQRALLLLARADPGADLGQLLGRRAAVGRQAVRVALLLQLQPPDALHEELVEIAAEDGEELEAIEQRHRRIRGLGQDPRVELEPGELAVEERRRAPPPRGS